MSKASEYAAAGGERPASFDFSNVTFSVGAVGELWIETYDGDEDFPAEKALALRDWLTEMFDEVGE